MIINNLPSYYLNDLPADLYLQGTNEPEEVNFHGVVSNRLKNKPISTLNTNIPRTVQPYLHISTLLFPSMQRKSPNNKNILTFLH